MAPGRSSRRVWILVGVLALASAAVILGGRLAHTTRSLGSGPPEAILVLAGGVDRNGVPHCTVTERLRAAAQASAANGGIPIVLNGGGTTWKPRYVDPNGYAIPEAALMARELADKARVPYARLYPESFSDDTIGNAFFARTMHTELRPEWRRLLVITSHFQMARTRAIYRWIFGLEPAPSEGGAYALTFEAVDDSCLDARVLEMRRAKEIESLRKFEQGPLVRMKRLAEVHEFIFRKHSGYSAEGVLSKQPLDSKLADTY